MISIPDKSPELNLASYFEQPILKPLTALQLAINMLGVAGFEPNRYRINTGHGRRHKMRKATRVYSKEETLKEISIDDDRGFFVHPIYELQEKTIHVAPPFEICPFQSFIISGPPGLSMDRYRDLIQQVSQIAGLAFAGINDGGGYVGWQRCDDPAWYANKFGPISGFRILRDELPAPLGPIEHLDISKNPGRVSSVNRLPVFVAADMWLGRAFWKYAPCTKEEVLKEPWMEVEDTEHYLYVKAYPEPFTRPDGEQGRLQRRLWNVLFHQDSEWPPGSGRITG